MHARIDTLEIPGHGVTALRLNTWLSVERAQQDRDRSGDEMLSG